MPLWIPCGNHDGDTPRHHNEYAYLWLGVQDCVQSKDLISWQYIITLELSLILYFLFFSASIRGKHVGII